jgi:nitrogen fixation-related uncharacterized protein
MTEAIKTSILIGALATLAFLFGIEVGTFEERQRNARLLMLRFFEERLSPEATKPASPSADDSATGEPES